MSSCAFFFYCTNFLSAGGVQNNTRQLVQDVGVYGILGPVSTYDIMHDEVMFTDMRQIPYFGTYYLVMDM